MEKEEDGVEIKLGKDGATFWYLHGVVHRGDGLAVEYPDGEKWWFQFGKQHREDGPAIERADGTKQWFRDGLCHRDDGPAVEYVDCRKEYYLNGEKWNDGASILARQKAEKNRHKKRPLCPQPFKKP